MACCAPGREPDDSVTEPTVPLGAGTESGLAAKATSVVIEGGTFLMGTSHPVAYPEDGEAHVHEVTADEAFVRQMVGTQEAHALNNTRPCQLRVTVIKLPATADPTAPPPAGALGLMAGCCTGGGNGTISTAPSPAYAQTWPAAARDGR